MSTLVDLSKLHNETTTNPHGITDFAQFQTFMAILAIAERVEHTELAIAEQLQTGTRLMMAAIITQKLIEELPVAMSDDDKEPFAKIALEWADVLIRMS